MKPLVLYHAGCLDGFTAAWVVSKALGEYGADYLPVNYGQSPPDVAGRDVLIVDFSYPRDVMLTLAETAYRIAVLDHHKTAQADLAGFQPLPSLDAYRLTPGAGEHITVPCARVFVFFDMRYSGARLAHNWLFLAEPASWLVNYTEDRDLWRHTLPHTHEVTAFLQSLKPSFSLWDELDRFSGPSSDDWPYLVREGIAILRMKEQQIARITAHAYETMIGGYRVLCANTPCFQSEVAGKLAEGRPFGAAWYYAEDGKCRYSLRSSPDGLDVSEIARAHGGGGHKHAAGYEVESA